MSLMGYVEADVVDMLYGVDNAILLIDSDENPAIIRYLQEAADFFTCLLEEGRV